jgi:hypothetical protein
VSFSLAVLDAFSDLIFQKLHVYKAIEDTALDYESQPVMLHASFDTPLGAHFRIEGHGGYMPQAVFRAYVQEVPDSGFRQEETYGFVGALFEWIASPRVTSGVFATYVNAVTDRKPLPDGRPVDDYRLTERTTQVGVHFLARPASHWVFQSWVRRMWRPEWRVYPTAAAPDVDYQEVFWSGQAVVRYAASDGFTLSTALNVDDRHIVRGDGEVPAGEELGGHNNQVRMDFGWRFPSHTMFTLGAALDLDPEHRTRGWFAGGQGRFVLYW